MPLAVLAPVPASVDPAFAELPAVRLDVAAETDPVPAGAVMFCDPTVVTDPVAPVADDPVANPAPLLPVALFGVTVADGLATVGWKLRTCTPSLVNVVTVIREASAVILAPMLDPVCDVTCFSYVLNSVYGPNP